MRNKIMLLVGFGVGYVLGSRAGRGRYEQIKRGWLSFWNSPGVQSQVQSAQEFVTEKAPDVVDFVSDTAKKLVSRSDSKSKSKAKSSTSSRSSTKSGGSSAKSGSSSRSSGSKSGSGSSSGSS